MSEKGYRAARGVLSGTSIERSEESIRRIRDDNLRCRCFLVHSVRPACPKCGENALIGLIHKSSNLLRKLWGKSCPT
jgi:hypothetical protein